MRASAILMGILVLSLTGCGLEPQVRQNSKDALGKLKGPETTSIDKELSTQAQQATAQGDYKQAVQIYQQLTDKSPDNVDYEQGYAEALRRTNNCNFALKITDKIVAKDPSNVPALENKGLCLMSTGEFAEAGDVFGKVMKIDNKRWRTLNGIGILFAMKGKYDDAVAYFQAALNISTDNPSVLNNAALTYAIDRQFDHSYDAFSRARRHVQEGSLDQKHLDLNLALVYAVDGKLDMAEQTATPYLSKEGLYNNMGFYSYLSKNNELAKGYLNMALTQSPTYYERAWKNLGALTGDPNAGAGQPMMPPGVTPSMPVAPDVASTAMPVPSAGISLDDIPESRGSQHAAGIPGMAGDEKPATKAKATPAPQKTAMPTATTQSNAADVNPDIVMLHKPAPQQNGDWDAPPKKDDAASAAAGAPPPADAAPTVPGGAPAAGN